MKLFIFALDGFDPHLFNRWRDHLPHLARLAASGSFRPIASTIPAMTFPAWSTFLTGVNPGKHGIFDFTERVPGKYSLRFLNATRRRYPTFLRLASDQGLRVGSLGLPTTYPPEPLNGYQISGFDTPVPSRADPSYIYPRSLADQIQRDLGGYYFGDFNESRIGSTWHRRVYAKLLQGLDRKQKLVHYLQKNCPVDVLLLHVGETDTVGHHFWSFFDAQSPRYVSPPEHELSEAIFRVYQAADALVGDLCEATRPDHVLIVSDHGMGGTSDRVIYLNRFLVEQGFLQFSSSGYLTSGLGKMKTWGLKYLPYRFQQQVFKIAGGRVAANLESAQRFRGIVWSKTRAYSEELNYFPAVYLNLKGREPEGLIEPRDVQSVVADLTSALLNWRDLGDDKPIVRKVHRREDLYEGPEAPFAPDLILELNQPSGYSYALGRSVGLQGRSSWRRLEPREYLGYKGASMNGAHRPQGTFILKTDRASINLPENLSLVDVAPTILSLLNLSVPASMERPELIPPRIEESTYPENMRREILYTRREEAALQKQLVNLGYLG